jgi:hypothetical protein
MTPVRREANSYIETFGEFVSSRVVEHDVREMFPPTSERDEVDHHDRDPGKALIGVQNLVSAKRNLYVCTG